MRLTPMALGVLKCGIHLLGVALLGWLILAVQQDYFGADAAKEVIKYCGRTALEFLFLTLLISPLALWTRTPALIRVRRLVGLWCFFWACLHLLAFAALELGWDLSLLLEEVIKRPYMLLGSLSWLLLLALAVTSNRWSQQQLGRSWASFAPGCLCCCRAGAHSLSLVGESHHGQTLALSDGRRFTAALASVSICPW